MGVGLPYTFDSYNNLKRIFLFSIQKWHVSLKSTSVGTSVYGSASKIFSILLDHEFSCENFQLVTFFHLISNRACVSILIFCVLVKFCADVCVVLALRMYMYVNLLWGACVYDCIGGK